MPVERGPPALGGGICVNHSVPGDLFQGTPARRNERSDHGVKVWRQAGVTWTLSVPLCHAHLGTRPWSQCWSGLIWSSPSGVTTAAAAICPRSLWNCFSGAAVLFLNVFKQFNTDWARSCVRRAVWLTESNSIPRKEILCTGESSALFPVDLEGPVPSRPSPVGHWFLSQDVGIGCLHCCEVDDPNLGGRRANWIA